MTQRLQAMDTLDRLAYHELDALLHQFKRYAVKAPAALDTPAFVLAFSYLRFSSPAQAEGDSVRRQTALRDGWLKRNPSVRLDTSLRLVDAGVSGYTGEHRKNGKHALASFLDLVERGRVPVGSYLIVENLDRLTRENPIISIPAVLNLIAAGIRVVQLAPVEIVYDGDMEQHHLMNMLWELARGHGESKRKSGVCGEAWMAKKIEARGERKPHGKSVPAWLELAGGKYRVREDAGRAVRLMFRLSAEGLGTLAIAARLNAEGVPPIARGKRWIRSYVAKILSNRAVLGEYQPMKGHRGRVADGEPVADYFPAVVTEQDWFAAHGAAQARNKRCGRPGKKGTGTHVFQGMLRCALDRCPLHVITRKGKKLLVSANAAQGEAGAHWRPFPLDTFVAAVLSMLKELEASELFAEPGGGRVTELTGRLAEVDKRLAVAVQRFDADPESPTWSNQVSKCDREKRALTAELTEARQAAANPLSAAWAEAVLLMAEDDPDRLRAMLLTTILDVRCLLLSRGRDRIAAVQVWFSGGEHRDYVILHRQAVGGAAGQRPPQWGARSFSEAGLPNKLDLRDSSHVRRLETALASLDLTPRDHTP
jgi:DNA invertase Pin-like site-specific DNA recombinase